MICRRVKDIFLCNQTEIVKAKVFFFVCVNFSYHLYHCFLDFEIVCAI